MRERNSKESNSNSTNGVVMSNTNEESHLKYLKEFRVVQCPLFVQRKCTQHRPFTCFNWHFMNQRRRKPIRKRDRTFNYSADTYCTKYDETTGICPDGDECPNLHRTAGDTERRYHLRYYKTCMCVHDTDNRGFCVKNGPHCAFAHGNHDLRPPVYDAKEMQAMENSDADPTGNGPNILDKERNLLNEDPKWGDTTYVLSNYKTEQCKRPPRLCRQGYACPQYHNSKDKRRSPRKFKYRSTPCPNVKHGEEWGEPGNCEQGDNCQYCHTRTEQQFHPEIYKSTKCNDVQTAGYCPRGVFCAFAHVDPVISAEDVSVREMLPMPIETGALAEILNNALPCSRRQDKEKNQSDSSLAHLQNGSGEISESASTSSLGSNGSHNKAPGAQLHQNSAPQKPLSNLLYGPSLLQNSDMTSFNTGMLGVDTDPFLSKSDKSQKKQNSFSPYNMNSLTSQPGLSSSLSSSSYYPNETVESVIGNALEDAHISDDSYFNLDPLEREANSPLHNSISVGLASSGLLCNPTPPVNIPGMSDRTLSFSHFPNMSPTSSPLSTLQNTNFLSSGSRFSQQDQIETPLSSFMNNMTSEPFGNHLSQSSGSASNLGFNNSLFDFPPNQGISPSSRPQTLGASPLVNSYSMSPNHNSGSQTLCEIKKLKEELASCHSQLNSWNERIRQARAACSAWQIESGECKRKQVLAEKERDEAILKLQALKQDKEANDGLKSMSLADLKSEKMRVQNQLEEIDKAIKQIITPPVGERSEVFSGRVTEQARNPPPI